MKILKVSSAFIFLIIIFMLFGCTSDNKPSSFSWQMSKLVETTTGNAEYPKIAFDSSGNGIAVWSQITGSGPGIWASHYNSETDSWDSPTQIAMGGGQFPQLVVSSSGDAVVVWYQTESNSHDIWSVHYTAVTKSWSTAELIQSDFTNYAQNPKVAIDANGNAVAVWYQSGTNGIHIWTNRYNSATKNWNTAEMLNPDQSGNSSDPDIAIDGSGNAIAVWTRSDGIGNNVWSSQYSGSTNTWGAAEMIQTNTPEYAGMPKVAYDPFGDAVVVWFQANGILKNVWSNRFNATSKSWGIAELIQTQNTNDALDTQIAVDAFGNTIAVWSQYDGEVYKIWSCRYSVTEKKWGNASLIESSNLGNAFAAQVKFDFSGNAIVVWSQYYNVWSNRYSASTASWGTASVINNVNSGAVYLPQIAIDTHGKAVAIWSQYDNGYFSIYSNSYR